MDESMRSRSKEVGMDYDRWGRWWELDNLKKNIDNTEGAIWDDPSDDDAKRELVSAYDEYERLTKSLVAAAKQACQADQNY